MLPLASPAPLPRPASLVPQRLEGVLKTATAAALLAAPTAAHAADASALYQLYTTIGPAGLVGLAAAGGIAAFFANPVVKLWDFYADRALSLHYDQKRDTEEYLAARERARHLNRLNHGAAALALGLSAFFFAGNHHELGFLSFAAAGAIETLAAGANYFSAKFFARRAPERIGEFAPVDALLSFGKRADSRIRALKAIAEAWQKSPARPLALDKSLRNAADELKLRAEGLELMLGELSKVRLKADFDPLVERIRLALDGEESAIPRAVLQLAAEEYRQIALGRSFAPTDWREILGAEEYERVAANLEALTAATREKSARRNAAAALAARTQTTTTKG